MKHKPSNNKPTSIGAIRRINRKCTRQRDLEIDQRHKAALKVLDQVEQRAIYDAAAHGRRPVEMPSDACPPPPPRPIQHPTPDTILLGMVIITLITSSVIVFSIWLAK